MALISANRMKLTPTISTTENARRRRMKRKAPNYSAPCGVVIRLIPLVRRLCTASRAVASATLRPARAACRPTSKTHDCAERTAGYAHPWFTIHDEVENDVG